MDQPPPHSGFERRFGGRDQQASESEHLYQKSAPILARFTTWSALRRAEAILGSRQKVRSATDRVSVTLLRGCGGVHLILANLPGVSYNSAPRRFRETRTTILNWQDSPMM